ncbi:MAG TPA: peptidase [Firmicutes bacterium]|nr:peptidase [Bacillota bacterium]
MSKREGYYRYPTVYGDSVVFVSEDDLWKVPVSGGPAFRLTSNQGPVSTPYFSGDGKFIAFIATEEGYPEVFVMPSSGGVLARLTFLGSPTTRVIGWSKDGKLILFSSSYGQPNPRMSRIFSVSPHGGRPKMLPVGDASHISFGPGNKSVIGRNTGDPARWKRYRGGTAGHLWIDISGKGKFKRLLEKLKTNITSPMWIRDRIYFISDHEGIGNIYSVLPAGNKLKRHTKHDEYYVRNATTDGKRIVYQSGGDLFLLDIKKNKAEKIKIDYFSPKIQIQRKFVSAERYIQGASLSFDGESIALNTRGRIFNSKLWEGPVFENGEKRDSRYRLPEWLKDGKRILAVTDEDGEERLVIYNTNNIKSAVKLPAWDLGRIVSLEISPEGTQAALINHRFELYIINLKTKTHRLIDRSDFMNLGGMAWSPDGKWLAYNIPFTSRRTGIKICDVKSFKTHKVTNPELFDSMPEFSQDGKYLFYISACVFNPVYDQIQFELGFMNAEKICVIPLLKTTKLPFEYKPEDQKNELSKMLKLLEKKKKAELKKPEPVKIDFDNIEQRAGRFPIEEGRYGRLCSAGNKLFFSQHFPTGALSNEFFSEDIPAKGILKFWDFSQQKEEVFVSGITDFSFSKNRKKIIYFAGRKIRIVSPEKSPEEKPSLPSIPRVTGWYDYNRIKLEIYPVEEWKQMFMEAWRLQRDHFWVPDMSDVDWKKVFYRYFKLIDRLGSRSEFSDIMWEMQGELGTSHAYEFGGDYRPRPVYLQGLLGCEFIWDKNRKAYRIMNIVNGDPKNKEETSPLLTPGYNIKEGDYLIAINGKKLSEKESPEKLLVNKAATDVCLTIKHKNGKTAEAAVKTLASEFSARYRDWVERNRELVHKSTKGKTGYVHIPDMGPRGFSEFHRYFLAELTYDSLIVDVRYNGGGHVSQLIAEKLARKILGYDISRWSKEPESYPGEAVKGPIVAITNEHAGSDGDIFSHVFKMMKIGPLVGKRTWGGVIGIWPRHLLVDNTITTQPEFSFWFKDVGWNVENYGTDPDYDVDITPEDYVKGKDPQIEKAVELVKNLLKKTKIAVPDLKTKPKLTLPKLKK